MPRLRKRWPRQHRAFRVIVPAGGRGCGSGVAEPRGQPRQRNSHIPPGARARSWGRLSRARAHLAETRRSHGRQSEEARAAWASRAAGASAPGPGCGTPPPLLPSSLCSSPAASERPPRRAPAALPAGTRARVRGGNPAGLRGGVLLAPTTTRRELAGSGEPVRKIVLRGKDRALRRPPRPSSGRFPTTGNHGELGTEGRTGVSPWFRGARPLLRD